MPSAGAFIRAWRDRQKPRLTQTALAAKLGMTKSNLNLIEHGATITDAVCMKLMQLGLPAAAIRPDLAKAFKKQPAAKAKSRVRAAA